MLWVQISLINTTHLYVGNLYRPPGMNNLGYLDNLETCLTKIPNSSRIWLTGNFNFPQTNWNNLFCNNNHEISNQLIKITNDQFLEQIVQQPTRFNKRTNKILDLFFTNIPILIKTLEVILRVFDKESIYVEASLNPFITQGTHLVFCISSTLFH